VQTQQAKLNPKKEPRKTGWMVAAVAVGVTIMAIGAVVLLSPSQASNQLTGTPPTTAVAPSPPTTAVVQSGPTTYEVEAFDYGFSGLPAELRAGDAIELVNTSSTEYHNLVVIRLESEDDRSIDDFSELSPEAFGVENPQPGFITVGALHAAPGESAFDGRIRLQVPGRYLVFDLIPQGADAAVVEENVNPSASAAMHGAPWRIPGGPLGYEHGMITIVTVTAK
jgi:hypothetical protein